jgi:hypothetical protein
MTDIFYRLIDDINQTPFIKDEMEELRKYANTSLARISTIFNSKKYEINKKYVFC